MDKRLTETEVRSSAEIEAKLSHDFKKKQPVTTMQLPFTATSIVVPKTNKYPAHTLSMHDDNNRYKRILYKAIIAAYNYAFFDKSAAITAKDNFSHATKPFVTWLNAHRVENHYEILKRYETDRMDELDNHGGESPLNRLRTVLSYAIESEALRDEVESDDFAFLLELKKTKPTPNLNRTQCSIASYFGALDWLRRDDIGIGSKLYACLASPKFAVNSLSLTAATVIIELIAYKQALTPLLNSIELQLRPWLELDIKTRSCSKKRMLVGNLTYQLISAYHRQAAPSDTLKSAMETLLLSNAISQTAYSRLSSALESQADCNRLFLNKIGDKAKVNAQFCDANFTASMSGALFSIEVIQALMSLQSSQAITKIEERMFAWLMASLTVQPTDITKLTHKDFRQLKVGGRATHIECEYFKGRARVFHTTRSLSTRTPEGQALLTLMAQQDEGAPFCSKTDIVITNNIQSFAGSTNALLQSSGMSASLQVAHTKQQLPYLMPSALCALISNGVSTNNCSNTKNIPIAERKKLVSQSQSPSQNSLFGLQAVKNSAVHAFSDPYTLEYLINRNSHSNQTEKSNYLTEDNEAWVNNAGRITREVMLDLIQNVFDLGFERDDDAQLTRFNSEFMSVTENIAYKHEEMNARLRLVTGQAKGRINEVGVLTLNNQNDSEPLSPIFVADNPITVLKMLNYLHEFKKHYKKLLAHNPDFLFKTVMPTVEWIEDTLKKMSKSSLQKGQERFQMMVENGVVMTVFHSM
ncbi:hypothetical protein SKA34_01667 [Photobacterium sp. SKA34]|uniref:hypothetical protein n=1 Tax=Photobacterium sp. SKA34 TaxID=121723 RepID=UPI00006BB5B0|nr:hypothetical protein [Photobacterium sp. SKA34]EAR56574.1 hypothetical protein SKA34_01667 [Photobacterium sp. SKA34]